MRYRVLCNGVAIGELDLTPNAAGSARGRLIAAPAAQSVRELVAAGWRTMRNLFAPATREQQAAEEQLLAAFRALRLQLETPSGNPVPVESLWADVPEDGELHFYATFDA